MCGNTILSRKIVTIGREVSMPDVGLRNVQWKLIVPEISETDHNNDAINNDIHKSVHHPVPLSPKLSKSKKPFWPAEETEGIVKNGKLDFEHILTNDELEEQIKRNRKLSKSLPENADSSSS